MSFTSNQQLMTIMEPFHLFWIKSRSFLFPTLAFHFIKILVAELHLNSDCCFELFLHRFYKQQWLFIGRLVCCLVNRDPMVYFFFRTILVIPDACAMAQINFLFIFSFKMACNNQLSGFQNVFSVEQKTLLL